MYPPTDKIRLIHHIRAEYAFLERTLAALTPEQMIAPTPFGAGVFPDGSGWSAKDMLIHLAGWHDRTTIAVPEWRAGRAVDEIEPGYRWDTPGHWDAANDLILRGQRDTSLEQAWAYFRQSYDQLMALIETMPEAELEGDYGGLIHQPMIDLLWENTGDHYYIHIVPIRQWLNGTR